MFYLYILQNPQGHFYIGQTQNLQERLFRHQQGRSPYTKHRGPWSLVYSETFSSRSEAIHREKYIKSQKNPRFIYELLESSSVG